MFRNQMSFNRDWLHEQVAGYHEDQTREEVERAAREEQKQFDGTSASIKSLSNEATEFAAACAQATGMMQQVGTKNRDSSTSLVNIWTVYGATACLEKRYARMRETLDSSLQAIDKLYQKSEKTRILSEALERAKNTRRHAVANAKAKAKVKAKKAKDTCESGKLAEAGTGTGKKRDNIETTEPSTGSVTVYI